MKHKARTKEAGSARGRRPAPRHPRDVSTLLLEPEAGAPDQPFAQGVADELDPDLRHRLVSEAAFLHQVERGYNSDYEDDDWGDAASEVDHLNLNPPRGEEPDGGR